MRANGVVVMSPCFDHDLGLLERVEDLAVEQLIAELSVEAIVVAVLTGAAWLDAGGPRPDGSDPVSERLGHELWAIVRADVIRHAAQDEEIRQNINDVCGLDLACLSDRQGLAGEL